jgi:hypothetical protein
MYCVLPEFPLFYTEEVYIDYWILIFMRNLCNLLNYAEQYDASWKNLYE